MKTLITLLLEVLILVAGFLLFVAVFFVPLWLCVSCSSPPSFTATISTPAGKEVYHVSGTWDDGQNALMRSAGPVGVILGSIIQTLAMPVAP